MREFFPRFPQFPLIRATQPTAAITKDPQRLPKPARTFRRFLHIHERRIGDMKPTTWSQPLATKRLIIQEELASIAAKPDDAEVPHYELRVERISIAMYLLCRAGAIIRKTPDFVPSKLWPSLLHVDELLGKSFFTEPAGPVAFHYDAIKSSLEAQGFCILNADTAAKNYTDHVKKRVAQLRKSRQEPPKHLDVTA